MPAPRMFYYITDRTAFAADEPTRRRRLLEKIHEAAQAGVEYIQLREKDLPIRDLQSLAQEAMKIIRDARKLPTDHWQPATALLINSRTDVALAIQADGVHLRSHDVSPQVVREIWKKHDTEKCGAGTSFDRLRAGSTRQLSPQTPLIAASCHSPTEVAQSAANAATFAVFAPVFEKKDATPAGLEALHEACKNKIPVMALGGIALSNAQSCLDAGAAGIAAIRLFQEHNIANVVASLRSSS